MKSERVTTNLGSLLSLSNGKSSPERSSNLPYPVYGGNGIIGFSNEANSSPGTIIIGRVGSYCGSVHFSNSSCWVTDNAIRAKAMNGNDPRFLFYMLHTLRLNDFQTGSGQPLLNQTILSQIPATIPGLSEQRRIAHILSTLDDKIELNRQMNETLEATARAIFKSWFVDFDPVKAKMDGRRPKCMDTETAALFPSAFQDSPLRRIPKGWQVGTIDEDFNLTMGQSPPGSTYNEDEKGVPFYQGSKDFGFRYPARRVYCTTPKRFAEKGDTLVSVRAPVGDINMASEKCNIGRGVAAVRHKTGSRSYTYYTMQFLQDVFSRYEAEGTVFGSINKTDFQTLAHLRPPNEIIEVFERLVHPLDQTIENNENESRALAQTRDTLLPKLLSGEIRIDDANEILEENDGGKS
ncbi:MAG: restriction endonuclease subunit S [Candidatus Poribacteria bacterium]|nr:restriction endonuclease subunit S [Candidatus Poribacteria bacterium]